MDCYHNLGRPDVLCTDDRTTDESVVPLLERLKIMIDLPDGVGDLVDFDLTALDFSPLLCCRL